MLYVTYIRIKEVFKHSFIYFEPFCQDVLSFVHMFYLIIYQRDITYIKENRLNHDIIGAILLGLYC